MSSGGQSDFEHRAEAEHLCPRRGELTWFFNQGREVFSQIESILHGHVFELNSRLMSSTSVHSTIGNFQDVDHPANASNHLRTDGDGDLETLPRNEAVRGMDSCPAHAEINGRCDRRPCIDIGEIEGRPRYLDPGVASSFDHSSVSLSPGRSGRARSWVALVLLWWIAVF